MIKQGTIIFKLVDEGSKSERRAPFLKEPGEVPPTPLYLKHDNPFENRGFADYEGKEVELVGEVDNGGTLVVESVKTI